MLIRVFCLIFFFVITSVLLMAHSGGTDGQGGHHDRKNGGYHFHHGKKAHQHPGGVCELGNFDRSNTQRVENKTNYDRSNNWVGYGVVGILGIGIGYLIRYKSKAKKNM